MIPSFTDLSVLPPGLHLATLAEIDARFGGPSEIRRVQIDELLEGSAFLDISLVRQRDFDYFVNLFFAFDRATEPKGMIEVLL